MKKIQLATMIWVRFCMNYPDIRKVIKWICKRTDKEWLEGHLNSKFKGNCETGTCYGSMSLFYCDIDADLRNALVEYAITVWAPEAMPSTYKEYCNL